MRKVWKTYESGSCTFQEMIMWLLGQWKGLIQPHNPIPTNEVEHIARNHVEAFVGLGCHGDERVWERKRVLDEKILVEKTNCEEVRENVKRWGRWREIRRERKETVGNHWNSFFFFEEAGRSDG